MFWRNPRPESAQSNLSAAPPSSRNSGISTSNRPLSHVPIQSIDEDSKYRAIIKYLHARIVTNQWYFQPGDSTIQYHGLLLRKSRGMYITEPEDVHPLLLGAVQKMNVRVAFTMSTETTRILFSILQPDQTELLLPSGFQVQVIDSLAEIACAPSSVIKKFQYVALVREERILLVWHDELDRILVHAADLETKFLSLICGSSMSPFGTSTPVNFLQSYPASPAPSARHFPLEANKEAKTIVNDRSDSPDEEAAKPIESLDRPVAFTSSVYVGLGMILLIVLLFGVGISNLLFQSLLDGNWTRFALAATIPFFVLLSIFVAIVVFGNIFQAFGPIKTLKTNSRFYSPQAPDLAHAYSQGFRPPRITIQMPVYTESLHGVLIPTITSLKAAISHYESHGGSATIFVNDDGFAYMSEDEQQERINFYHDNNIAWVARPKNNQDGYVRKGKFKKASNMNFALNVSNKVEDELLKLLESTLATTDMIDPSEEEGLFQLALERVLASDSRVTAGGDIRIGEYILIVDSDTRVPVDCLLYGAAEMFLSPEVAIIQHSTGVMQVTHDYFENGISFFTNLIYSAIRFAVGNGEIAPFVGHNAFLRWKAIQSVGKPDDGYVAYWSESHVSEDFDIALRLQVAGDIVRLASYHEDEFKEGVSLTIYDELTRWEKYAYGCNELVFNPIYTWLYRGPFTRLFLMFLWSDIQLSSKITILGYIFSYYAIASGFPLTVMNYFIVGWYNEFLDKYYLESWKVFLSLIVIFSIMGNLSLAILRYRLSEKTLWGALIENFKWMPVFAIFFGGLSFHVAFAILSQMFRINMQWGTTAKEKVDSNFFKEVPKIFKGFKWMYAIVLPLVGGMIYLGLFAPRGWEIKEIAAVIPMAVTLASHALLPLLLNPSLMIFNY